jgi:hypothetical protein
MIHHRTSGLVHCVYFESCMMEKAWGTSDRDQSIVMVQPINQRGAEKIEGDFVVFLAGSRLNQWWKFLSFMPFSRAMRRMVGELETKRDFGRLHVEI